MRAYCRTTGHGRPAMLVALAALAAGLPAEAGNGGSGRIFQPLTATTAAPALARGKAAISVRNADGKLAIVVFRLASASTFDVILDGVRIGSLTTGSGGTGKARFRSRPRSHDQLLGTDPRGKMLLLRSSGGVDVLVADIPAPLDPTPDDPDDDDIACCLPDDEGTECEDRTAGECAAQGGMNTEMRSCLPSPCGGVPGDEGDSVCCLPDDNGVECEDRTKAECASQHGMVVEGTSCASNPCAPIPPTNPDIQCCLPDDAGFECEDRTPETCAAQGGKEVGTGACTPDACSGLGSASGGGPDDGPGDDSGGSGSGNSGSGSDGSGSSGSGGSGSGRRR